MSSRLWRWTSVGVPALFLLVLFAWPVGTILVTSFTGGMADGTTAFTDSRTWQILWFTTWQALASTGLTLLVGLPGAWVASRVDFTGRGLFRAVSTVPFVLPTVVVATAFMGLLRAGSPVNDLLTTLLGRDRPVEVIGSVGAVLLAHVFFNYAVVVRTVAAAWDNLDRRAEQAAQTLGATPWQAFRRVVWPQLRTAVGAAASIVFLFTFTSFGVMLILGRGRLVTLEVEIYRATAERLDLDTAAVLALVQLAAVVTTLVITARLARRRGDPAPRSSRQVGLQSVRGWRARTWLGANLTIAGALVGLPLLALVERSVRVGEGYGLDHFRGLTQTSGVLFVTPLEAIANSLVFALLAAGIALVIGGLAATARSGGSRVAAIMDGALMLPLGTSAVTLGFGILITLDTPPLDLRSSVWLVPLTQALVATPFVVRTMVPALASIDPQLRQAARTLGATPRQVFRHVDLPIVFRSGAAAYGFALAVSLGEFGATTFIARLDRPTLPIAIFRLLGQPGAANFGRAMAMSVVLMLVTLLITLAVDRARVGEIGAF